MEVGITREMACMLIREFAWNKTDKLPDNRSSFEVLLHPYGSKIVKRKNKYFLSGYASNGSDIKRPLVEVWGISYK